MAPVSMKFPTAKLRRGSPDAYPRPVAARKIEDYYVFPMGSGFCAVGQSRTPTAMVAANWRSCDVAWALLRPAQAQRPRPPTSRRLPLRLPPHAERSPGSAALPLLPQTALPTAVSITAPSPRTSRLANLKPPTTALTRPFNKSSISLPLDALRLFDSSSLPFSELESNRVFDEL